MELVEQICRQICISEGVDPDKESYGLGNRIPDKQKFKLWESRVETANHLIEHFNIKTSKESFDKL